MAIKLGARVKGQMKQMELMMEGLPRVWRSVSWYSRVNASGTDKVGRYEAWLRFHDGLGNGGEL